MPHRRGWPVRAKPRPRRGHSVGRMDTTKTAPSTVWALGDYHRFSTQLVWSLGRELVAACGIGPGDRVLDVATGTGNVALRAAEAGAHVVACDLTPEHFEAGRREAAARGVDVEWVRADAQALPFGDGEFDVVTSCLGAIFAPDHGAVARELLRVCRPGGTIGMINFTPEGLGGEFFGLLAPYAPGGDGPPPLLWGAESHVRELLGGAAALDLARREYAEGVPGGPGDYVRFFKETFGPVVAVYSALDSSAAGALERDFLAFAQRANQGPAEGPVRYVYEYLLVVARLHAG
jgi:SAM-dependent methyltransferase